MPNAANGKNVVVMFGNISGTYVLEDLPGHTDTVLCVRRLNAQYFASGGRDFNLVRENKCFF
jgi:hypothetical protein